MMKNFIADICYLFYTILHPFDGFYELRFRKKKSVALILLIYVIYGIVEIFHMRYTGIIMRTWDIYALNGVLTFFSALFPMVLFAVSNWSVTTLSEGNGRLSDIFMVLAYAVVPKIVISFLVTILSNFIIAEEVIILTTLELVGTALFCFLVFAGLCVIHEFTPIKTVLTLITTLIAAIIIFFILVFYFSIIGKMLGFVSVILTEISN